jgi:hypothetical protein
MTTVQSAAAVADVVDRFNAAWNAHDLDAAIALISADCVFESTSPAPDGDRYVGPDAIRAAWAPIFDDTNSSFTVERAFVAGDRLVQQWRYSWGDGHIRGVDVIGVRQGLACRGSHRTSSACRSGSPGWRAAG